MTKYFPIKTKTSCQLKWAWSSIYLYRGETNSCHRVSCDTIPIDDFSSFHNTSKKINDRQLMLEGKWPEGGCEYCKKIEDAGGVSDRLMQLQVPDLFPPELDKDVKAVKVTPRIVEVYFDNVCNMSCVYCSDVFSSKIQQENIKFGKFEDSKTGLLIDNTYHKHSEFDRLTESFWQWLDENYETTRRFHILGGEPFYQKQFDQYIDFLYNRSNPNLEVNVISNLMVDHDHFSKKIELIKKVVAQRKIKRFDLTASIDCWGEQQEYIRNGLKLDQWKKNFEYVVNEKWITLNINQVISALSIPTIKPLIEYINIHRQHRQIGHHLILAVTPTYMNPDIFGSELYQKFFDEILTAMPENTWQQKEIKKYMNGVMLRIQNAQPQPKEIAKLKVYLDELDRRRNTNWKQTFPWLVKELENVV